MKNLFISNELRDISVCGENLGGAIFDGLSVRDAKFIQCDFSNARIGLRKNVNFENTVFQKVDFRSVGQVNAVYDNCKFIGCDFRGTRLDDLSTKYFSCLFDKCKITDQKFLVNNFQKNTIIGKISEVQFIGGNQRLGKLDELNLNLSACKISFFKFINCDISNIVPPDFSNYIFIKDLKTKIQKANEKLELDDLSAANKKTMERKLRHLGGLDAYLFNVEDEIYINGLEFTEKFFFYLGVDTACLLK